MKLAMELDLKQLKSALTETLQIIEIYPGYTCLCCSNQFTEGQYQKLKEISKKYFGGTIMLKRDFFQEHMSKLMPEKLADGEKFTGFKLDSKTGKITAFTSRGITI